MPRRKTEKKEKNPLDYLSSKYPFLHTLEGAEQQEFFIDDANCTYGVCMNNLRKNWIGYKIAKRENDYDRMLDYASRIQEIQRAIGFRVAEFPDLPLSAADPYDDV